MSNATALRTVLEHITAHPEGWDQRRWVQCFAGQTLRVLAGAREITGNCGCPCALAVEGEELMYGSNIGVRAAQLLGLEPEQAYQLFQASNSLKEIAALVEEFTADKAAVAAPQVALAA